MGALAVDIAEAVVAELNGAALSQSLNAVRGYRPLYELEELTTLRVTVVPKAIAITSATRTANQHDLAIDVAVQKRATETAELDALMALVEEVGDFLRLRRLSNCPSAIWQKTENVPVYSPEHLETKQVFTSVLTVTFRVIR